MKFGFGSLKGRNTTIYWRQHELAIFLSHAPPAVTRKTFFLFAFFGPTKLSFLHSLRILYGYLLCLSVCPSTFFRLFSGVPSPERDGWVVLSVCTVTAPSFLIRGPPSKRVHCRRNQSLYRSEGTDTIRGSPNWIVADFLHNGCNHQMGY